MTAIERVTRIIDLCNNELSYLSKHGDLYSSVVLGSLGKNIIDILSGREYLVKKPCEHEKVFDERLTYTMDGVKTAWICNKCGDKGLDLTRTYQMTEYDKVCARFGK